MGWLHTKRPQESWHSENESQVTGVGNKRRGSHVSKEDGDDHPQEFGREGKEETVVMTLVFVRSRVAP